MKAALWSINILLLVIGLVFLPFAWRQRDPVTLGGLLMVGAGFTLATVALFSM